MSTNDEAVGSNFTPFYITITVCGVFIGTLIIVNIICFCCSKYRWYCGDRNTGNLQLWTLWSSTPKKKKPLDLSKLKGGTPANTQHEELNEDIETAPIQQPQ